MSLKILSTLLVVTIALNSNISWTNGSVTSSSLSKEEIVLNHIVKNEECFKALLFLLGKKPTKKKLPSRYTINKKPAIKVSKYVYSGFHRDDKFSCTKSNIKLSKIDSLSEKLNLYTFSNTNDEDKFLLYFSEKNGDYLECTIVAGKKSENNFFTNTRFGKKVVIKFCFGQHEILNYKISRILAG